ncbi:MAG: potassium channel family protein [Acetobacteraceae bacterium]|nr:potassium channel family protein [Acetobacteraceae bacterium]
MTRTPAGMQPPRRAHRSAEAARTRLRRQLHAFAMAISLGVLLMLLVAFAIADRGGPLPLTVPGVSALAMGVLYIAFPHGPQFSLGAATSLAMYACIYVVIGRAAFPEAPHWAQATGHALPIVVFVVVCLAQRDRLRRYAQQGARTADLMHLGDFMRWLIAAAFVGAVSLSAPVNRLDPLGQGIALVGAMAVIALISLRAVDDVVRLLVDMAVIFQTMTRRMQHLVVPMAAYTSLWALLAVVFACLYRIADGVSRDFLFHGAEGPMHIGFADALHFSVVTLTTVGYGDINPRDDGIRLLASIQMLLGQLLLLFGFIEIMRGVGTEAPPVQATESEAAAAPTRPAGAGE